MAINLDDLRVGGDGQVWRWMGPERGQMILAASNSVHTLRLPKGVPLNWRWQVECSKIRARQIPPTAVTKDRVRYVKGIE